MITHLASRLRMRNSILLCPTHLHEVTLNSGDSQLYLSFPYLSLPTISEAKNKSLAKYRLVYYFNWGPRWHSG